MVYSLYLLYFFCFVRFVIILCYFTSFAWAKFVPKGQLCVSTDPDSTLRSQCVNEWNLLNKFCMWALKQGVCLNQMQLVLMLTRRRWCLMVHCFVCCFFEPTTWKPKLTSIVKDSCTGWLALQQEAPSSSQAFKWLPCFFLCSHRNKVQALCLWHTHTCTMLIQQNISLYLLSSLVLGSKWNIDLQRSSQCISSPEQHNDFFPLHFRP